MGDPRAPEGGDCLGRIEPVVPGVWRWPFRHMRVGDYFTVATSDRPTGAVDALVRSEQRRLGMKFSVEGDGEVTRVTRVPEDEAARPTRGERAAARAILVGGDGDKYLGVLQPPEQGHWDWPFATMEPGQYFHVSHDDRHPERVRSLVMVRRGQLAMELSVNAHDPEKEGFARITYVDATDEKGQHDLTYEAFNRLLIRCYGCDVPSLRTEFLQDRIGEPPHKFTTSSQLAGKSDPKNPLKDKYEEVPLRQIEKPRFERYVFQDFTHSVGLEFHEDHILGTGLTKGTLYEHWKPEGDAEVEVDPFS